MELRRNASGLGATIGGGSLKRPSLLEGRAETGVIGAWISTDCGVVALTSVRALLGGDTDTEAAGLLMA